MLSKNEIITSCGDSSETARDHDDQGSVESI